MDYKYGSKNHWRRTIWNRIVERLNVPPSEALVVYLGGEMDLDRKIAREKGFRDENLILVDNDEKVVTAVRKRGHLAIHGDFLKVIQYWPHRRPIDVCFGDFCCGLNQEYTDSVTFKFLISSAIFNSVCAFNFLRGRDPNTNDLRSEINSVFKRSNSVLSNQKHRGVFLFSLLLIKVCQLAHGDIRISREQNGRVVAELRDLQLLSEEEKLKRLLFCKEIISSLKNKVRAEFFDYRSTKFQIFDSVVYVHPLRGKAGEEVKHQLDGIIIPGPEGKKIRRSIAAILAHRTRRLN